MLKFFQDLVEAGRKHEDRPDYETRNTLVTNLFSTHGENLVGNLITAAVFILPQYMHHDVAETFYQVSSILNVLRGTVLLYFHFLLCIV